MAAGPVFSSTGLPRGADSLEELEVLHVSSPDLEDVHHLPEQPQVLR